MDNVTNGYTLDEWNTDLSEQLIPNNIVLSANICFGILGNMLVLLVYKFRLQNVSDERFFIPILAVSDLSASAVSASSAIVLNLLQASFTNAHLCKVLWFFSAFTTFFSIFLLEIIAVQRYLKVCRPSGKQMNSFWKKIAIVCAFFMSFLMGFPTTFLYGSVDFPNLESRLVGKRCSKLHDTPKVFSFVYSGLFGLILISVITSLIGLYGKIGWTMFSHMRYMKMKSKGKSHCGASTLTVDTKIIMTLTEDPELSLQDTTLDQMLRPCGGEIGTLSNTKSKTNTEMERRNRILMNRFILMFMIITVVFLISFFPIIVLLFLEGRNPKFWEHFSSEKRAALLFFYRSNTINNVVNPFIYAFMDTQFRKGLISLLSRLKQK